MTSSGSANPFIGTQAADSMTDAKAVNGNGGVAASTSAGHPSKVRGNTIWDQWMTSTGELLSMRQSSRCRLTLVGSGWFAPLVPPEDPAKLAEKERKAEEQRRIEKERSVHSWRPSQDEASTSTSPVKKGVTRPSLMKRLSSAVELVCLLRSFYENHLLNSTCSCRNGGQQTRLLRRTTRRSKKRTCSILATRREHAEVGAGACKAVAIGREREARLCSLCRSTKIVKRMQNSFSKSNPRPAVRARTSRCASRCKSVLFSFIYNTPAPLFYALRPCSNSSCFRSC